MNLRSIAEPQNDDPKIVDLLFSPQAAAGPKHTWDWPHSRWSCGGFAERITNSAERISLVRPEVRAEFLPPSTK
jgi:hypothetical protein